MFTITDPLALTKTITEGLADRVLDTMKAGNLKTTAALYNDLIFLQAAVEQLAKEKKE